MSTKTNLRFASYRVANPAWKVVRNVYYRGEPWQTTIGVALVLGSRCLGVTWRRPVSPREWIKQGPLASNGQA